MAYTRINWQDLPSTATPRNATNLNKMDSAIKEHDDKLEGNATMGNVVVDSIRTKNMFDKNVPATRNYAGTIEVLETGIRMYTALSTNNQWAGFKLTNDLLGKTITISSTITPSSTNQGAIRMFYGTDGNIATQSANIELNTTGSITLTLLSSMPSGCDSIYLLLYANRTGTTQPNDYVSYTNLQIEEGNSATTYSPYQELNRPTIQTGSGTINTTYIDTVENNHYEKSGNVVVYSFTMKVKGTWGTTTEFITGLPKNVAFERFIGVNASNGNVLRFSIFNGKISNAYSNTTPSAGNIIEGCVVYMTED